MGVITIGELKGVLTDPAASDLRKRYATDALRAYSDTLKRWAAKGETGKHIEMLGETHADFIWSGHERLVTKEDENGNKIEEIVVERNPEAPGYLFVDSRPSNPTNLETKVRPECP